ncbi:MAG: VWA domain-containing protein [Chthonomonadales bacterium]|nr:VWA domain-containing protein [Chthonomonadales bacterium]
MEDRTHQIAGQSGPARPGPADRTVVTGAQGAAPDAMRTTMGAPMRGLEIEAVPGASSLYAASPTREHLLLLLRSSGAAVGRRMPLNLCLVIDRSGSMEGEPLEYVKRACGYVVDLLEPTDILSIVTFEEQVEVVMPARRVVNKALVKEHINRIQAGNTTNLYDGMVVGCQQVASVPPGGYLSRVLLLTDGEPTAGIKDFASIVGQVGEQRARGLSITALGFGSEYNEELMAGIARRSGGNYYYIAQPTLIPEVFRRELETLMTITARDVRVRISLPRGVQCRYVYGVPAPALRPRSVEFTLPDIERGSTVANLSELEIDRHVPGTYRLARVDVSYDDVVSARAETLTAEAVVRFVPGRAEAEATRNPIVQRELEVHLASRNLEKTMMGMRTQQLSAGGVMQELQRTRTVLMQAGRAEQAREVGQAMDALRQGGEVEKTLIGTIVNLDQGKKRE